MLAGDLLSPLDQLRYCVAACSSAGTAAVGISDVARRLRSASLRHVRFTGVVETSSPSLVVERSQRSCRVADRHQLTRLLLDSLCDLAFSAFRSHRAGTTSRPRRIVRYCRLQISDFDTLPALLYVGFVALTPLPLTLIINYLLFVW